MGLHEEAEVRLCPAFEDVQSAQRANTPSQAVPMDIAACENGSPHTSIAQPARDRVLRRDGVIDATQERFAVEGQKPLSAHLADYRAALVGRPRPE